MIVGWGTFTPTPRRTSDHVGMTKPDTYYAVYCAPADSGPDAVTMYRAVAAADAVQDAISSGHTVFTVTLDEQGHPVDPDIVQYQATVEA